MKHGQPTVLVFGNDPFHAGNGIGDMGSLRGHVDNLEEGAWTVDRGRYLRRSLALKTML